jgi:hypothetical protein
MDVKPNPVKARKCFMSQNNYDTMSDAELKRYFLRHREEITAFRAYMDRINQRPRRIIASPDDPDFDEKVQAVIRQKPEASIILRMMLKTVKLLGG